MKHYRAKCRGTGQVFEYTEADEKKWHDKAGKPVGRSSPGGHDFDVISEWETEDEAPAPAEAAPATKAKAKK